MAENTTQQGEIFRSLDEGWFREEVQGRWVGRDRILKSLVTIWTMESLTNFSEVSLLSYGASVRTGQGDQLVEVVISKVRDGKL